MENKATHVDLQVRFEAIPINKLDEFEKLIKSLGELVGNECIDFGIYDSYEVKND